MKNRERLTNTNQFDLLMRIKERTEGCPIEIVEQRHKYRECGKFKYNCAGCVQAWLNEKE